MYVNAVQCLKCKTIIFSRARHDFRSCTCGEVSIDGGFDYCKLSHKEDARMQFLILGVHATPKELYDDWNKEKDLFGLVETRNTSSERRPVRIMKEPES